MSGDRAPGSVVTAAAIDRWLPSFEFGERHEIEVPTTPERALERMLAVPLAPDRFVRLLFRLRGLRPDGALTALVTANGFTLLERTPTTYVVGLVARGLRRVPLDGASTWRGMATERGLRIAADFRAEPTSGGARLVTETRVAASGFAARAGFRLYWIAVAPLSKLIRRRWLRAAAAACVASP